MPLRISTEFVDHYIHIRPLHGAMKFCMAHGEKQNNKQYTLPLILS